jgi:hypothetical protein
MGLNVFVIDLIIPVTDTIISVMDLIISVMDLITFVMNSIINGPDHVCMKGLPTCTAVCQHDAHHCPHVPQ